MEAKEVMVVVTIMALVIATKAILISLNEFCLPSYTRILFEALQSEAGKKLLRRSGRAPDDISSVVLVEKDRSGVEDHGISGIAFPLACILHAIHTLARKGLHVRQRREQPVQANNQRLEQVRLWLSETETMITEEENLNADAPRQINNLCLGGCVSKNCLFTYKFGKKVAKMHQDIKDHMSKGVFKGSGDSARSFSDVGIIGLYGIGGVGKTILLTKITNKFSTTPQGFDIVIWAMVSKDYNVERIQDKIGGNIAKKMVANLLSLLGRRTFVVKMEARKKIKVECLKPEEAWKLFQNKVGDETFNSHPNIPNLAEQVAKEWGGLPLALITIARAMACKTTPGEWKYAIEKLKRSMLPKMVMIICLPQ
ncbi:hypothetical protein F3Y22_tig00016571pilonHSYRG00045 [Hibiscus syriacus]|uniref:NB-ARC domain-containing protein n=1 Tax=Hibiscus syriacus TaxID=106335 RepID=A0A6A3C1X0_HIBSY|nr:hypothetical protein F3Y22_tig00016571pilonHSYRG00045 [Hibiscus syriacus]